MGTDGIVRIAGRRAAAAAAGAALFLAACQSTPPAGSPKPPSRSLRPLVAACATGHPSSWMGCVAAADPAFASTPLSEVSAPGTHDAGTFDLSSTYDTQSGSDCTSYQPAFASVPGIVRNWSQTQDLDFTQQLDAGIRYLDLRIAYTGDPTTGWRIVHTLFSNDPLERDLASIAAWAAAHPSEVVVADVQHLCYDNQPDAAADAALWADFAPLGPVSVIAPAGESVASMTLKQATGARNVVVVLPSNALALPTLLGTDGVHATVVTAPGSALAPSSAGNPSIHEEYAWASAVMPTTTSRASFGAANRALEAYPEHIDPAIGSLAGTGFYQAQLIYSLSDSVAQDAAVLSQFSGLIPLSAHPGSPPAWESGLWEAPVDRNSVIAAWGRRLNFVVSDGVEHGGYIASVIEQNAA